MPSNDTPPTSPGHGFGEDEDMQVNNDIEVIELSSGEEENFIDEDDDAEIIDEDDEIVDEDDALGPAKEDNSVLVFEKHEKSVFCVDIQPKADQPLVASGGEDDTFYLWNIADGKIVMGITDFKDSVVHVKFNHDGTYVAAADMSGVIKVYKVSSKEVAFEFETGDITWLGWHPGANVLFVGTEDSQLWMWKIPSGDSKIFQGHGEKIETVQILHDGKRAAVGFGDGTMRIFDLKSGDVQHNVTGISGHDGSLCTIDSRTDNNLVATGGQDGSAKIFNTQSGKSIATFQCSKKDAPEAGTSAAKEEEEEEPTTAKGVEAVLFSQPEQNQLITGTLDGSLCVWDISSQVARLTTKPGTGIIKMAWRPGTQQLVVATLDGLVRLIDSKTGGVLSDCLGHMSSILDFSISGNWIVSSSDDGTCRVYDLSKFAINN